MKLMAFFLMSFIAFSCTSALADNSVDYKYWGDSYGSQICRTIVNDDVKKLQRVLRSYRQTLVFGYTFNDMTSQAIAGSFKCNDMELREFSHKVGAQNILSFLTTGKEISEERVVSTEK